jgi:hypothetical protein
MKRKISSVWILTSDNVIYYYKKDILKDEFIENFSKGDEND